MKYQVKGADRISVELVEDREGIDLIVGGYAVAGIPAFGGKIKLYASVHAESTGLAVTKAGYVITEEV